MRKIDLKSQLGSAIRNKRNDLGISQEELADRADLHRTYISDIERGARNLSLESIDKLATALQISISSLFSTASAPSPSSGEGAGTAANPVDILLVEDNDADAEMTLHAFKEARLSNNIRHIQDGAEALDYVFCRNRYSSRKPGGHPQVMLLDLNLPKVSGIEVLRQIKADDRTKSIHVIVLTVSQHDSDIAQCRRLGADTYIIKPVNFNRLSEVTAQLKLYWSLLKKPSSMVA